MSIGSFLDRVAILTEDTLGGGRQFPSLRRHLNLLLTGPALQSYWRYRRGVGPAPWNLLCNELRDGFGQPASDGNIQTLMSSRFQGETVPFDEHRQAILQLEDRSSAPLANDKLRDVLQAGISISLRRALLRQRLSTVAQLRQADGKLKFLDKTGVPG